MSRFVHQRYRPPARLPSHCDLVVACPPLRSAVNLSRIMRVAGCCGVERLIVCGPGKVDARIARDAAESVLVQRHRSLLPVLRRLQEDGYCLAGLEQTTGSECLYGFPFPPRTALVVGHERRGIDQSILDVLDHVLEIPVFGMPHSYNVATATAMALYEYCRRFTWEPAGGMD